MDVEEQENVEQRVQTVSGPGVNAEDAITRSPCSSTVHPATVNGSGEEREDERDGVTGGLQQQDQEMSAESSSPRQELKTSDVYKIKNIPKRFNHPGTVLGLRISS